MLGVVGLDPPLVLGVERGVARRDAVVRGALEDDEVGRLPGDDRDGLDGGGARADDADPLAGEVDARVRPGAGVMAVAAEAGEAREGGNLRRRQAADGHDAEAGRGAVAAIRLDRPAVRRLVEGGGGHARVELDVTAQVEAVGDVLDVAQDLRLGGVALGPAPVLLERDVGSRRTGPEQIAQAIEEVIRVVVRENRIGVEAHRPGPFHCASVGEGARRVGRAVRSVRAGSEHHHPRCLLQMERADERELLTTASETRARNRESQLSAGEKRGWPSSIAELFQSRRELPRNGPNVAHHVGPENLRLEAERGSAGPRRLERKPIRGEDHVVRSRERRVAGLGRFFQHPSRAGLEPLADPFGDLLVESVAGHDLETVPVRRRIGHRRPGADEERSSPMTSDTTSARIAAGATLSARRPPFTFERCFRTAFNSRMSAPLRRSRSVVRILSSSVMPSAGATRSAEAPPVRRKKIRSSARLSASSARRRPVARRPASSGRGWPPSSTKRRARGTACPCLTTISGPSTRAPTERFRARARVSPQPFPPRRRGFSRLPPGTEKRRRRRRSGTLRMGLLAALSKGGAGGRRPRVRRRRCRAPPAS